MPANLTEAQWRALAGFAADPTSYPRGVQPRTIGALNAAGFVDVTFHESEERYRPSRSWSQTRWTRHYTSVGVVVTDAGRKALRDRMNRAVGRPRTNTQGKAVVERSDDGFMVMMPDGSIEIAKCRAAAERKVKAWFKANADDTAFNVGTIEWR